MSHFQKYQLSNFLSISLTKDVNSEIYIFIGYVSGYSFCIFAKSYCKEKWEIHNKCHKLHGYINSIPYLYVCDA